MNTPAPLFVVAFAKPLAARLSNEAAIAKAEIVILDSGSSDDVRLLDQSMKESLFGINSGGSAARFLVQWPDGRSLTGFGRPCSGRMPVAAIGWSRGISKWAPIAGTRNSSHRNDAMTLTSRLRSGAARDRDVRQVLRAPRPADLEDARAIGLPFADVLRLSVREALWCRAFRDGDSTIALVGLGRSVDPVVGLPWLAGTTMLEAYAHTLVRRGRGELTRMLDTRPVLVNFLNAGNKVSADWLRSLGFQFLDPFLWPGTGATLLPFWIAKEGHSNRAQQYVRKMRTWVEATNAHAAALGTLQ